MNLIAGYLNLSQPEDEKQVKAELRSKGQD